VVTFLSGDFSRLLSCQCLLYRHSKTVDVITLVRQVELFPSRCKRIFLFDHSDLPQGAQVVQTRSYSSIHSHKERHPGYTIHTCGHIVTLPKRCRGVCS
jgi:hypothetical protein